MTPEENLAQIRSVFCPSVSDLVMVFNVTRQTIYGWMKGVRPTEEHHAKLEGLALAASMFVESRIPTGGMILKRKITEGKNLSEIVRDGGSAHDATKLLIQILQTEILQRERLNERLDGRTITQTSADVDLMEAYNEEEN